MRRASAAAKIWDGGLPEDLRGCGFKPLPVEVGTLVVFAGTLDHLSLPNRSNRSRHTFQLHAIEGGRGVKWAKSNWLQVPRGFLEV